MIESDKLNLALQTLESIMGYSTEPLVVEHIKAVLGSINSTEAPSRPQESDTPVATLTPLVDILDQWHEVVQAKQSTNNRFSKKSIRLHSIIARHISATERAELSELWDRVQNYGPSLLPDLVEYINFLKKHHTKTQVTTYQ